MLHPWMLRADWRDDARPFVLLDLATWPADLVPTPLPPIPVLALGPASHPQAHRADMVVEPPIALDTLVARIAATPRTAATLVQLLRAIDGLATEQALAVESFAFGMLQAGDEHAAWMKRQPRRTAMAPGTLAVSRHGDRLDLSIARPHARNAIDRAMRDALYEAFALATLDPGIATVRLRAQGRCFSMGADLAEFGTTRDPVESHAIRVRTLPAHMMVRRAGIYDVHVRGGCVGSGLEMAAFAGRLSASPDAWFALPEVSMGIVPGFGGCVSIPRRIGRQRAALLMLSGRRIGADTARRWGLIDAVMKEPSVDDRRPDEIG